MLEAEGKAAFGVFHHASEVKAAKAELKSHGFPSSRIEVLYPPRHNLQLADEPGQSMILGGALIGSIIGGLVFVVIGLMVNLGLLSLPNMKPPTSLLIEWLVVLMSLVAGVIFGAACGTLVGIGTPQPAGERFGHYVESGGILMSVHVNNSNESRRATEALEKTGAQDITLLDESRGWQSVHSNVHRIH